MLASASQHSSMRVLLILSITLLTSISGCSHTPSPTNTLTPPVAAQPFNGHVVIYAVDASGNSSQADANGLIPVQLTIDQNAKDPARQAIVALISTPNSPIPHGTKLLGITIDQTNGLATVDFSNEFKSNFPGGDTKEAQVVTSVEKTLGQFPAVQSIQFLINGEKIGSLGGTEDLSDPLPAIKAADQSAANS
jgi:germination protein M